MNKTTLFSLFSFMCALPILFLAGCLHTNDQELYELGDNVTPAPNGAISDEIWQHQERNAEASDFVIHEHEFVGISAVLNSSGEAHLKQIAARYPAVEFPVIIEPSSMSPRPGTKYGFPIHNDPALDKKKTHDDCPSFELNGSNWRRKSRCRLSCTDTRVPIL